MIRHGENDFGAFLTFSQYDLTVAYAPRIPAKPLGSLTAFELSENKFLLVGTECSCYLPGETG